MMTKREALRLVLEQGYEHKMIMPTPEAYSNWVQKKVQQPHRTAPTPCDRHRPPTCVNDPYRLLCP
jgi:hypothetical protein